VRADEKSRQQICHEQRLLDQLASHRHDPRRDDAQRDIKNQCSTEAEISEAFPAASRLDFGGTSIIFCGSVKNLNE